MEIDEIQKLQHTTEKLIALQMANFSSKTGARITKMNVKVYKTHPNAKLGFENQGYVYSVALNVQP